MKQVLILSAYGFEWEIPENTMTARGFIKALEAHNWNRGSNVSVEIFHAPDPADHEHFMFQRLNQGTIDLVYAGSASLMTVIRKVLNREGIDTVPLVYWGSHVVNQRVLVNEYPTESYIAGLVGKMPLYTNHRQFRVLKTLFPNLKRIYCPFSVKSAFYYPKMKKRYEKAIHTLGPDCWFESQSQYGGFPGLGRLAQVIDVTFFEHPCTNPRHLLDAIFKIPPSSSFHREEITAILLSGIECFHIPGAIETMIKAADERGVPYVGLNFTSFYQDLGPLAIFANDIHRASYRVGEMAAQILTGVKPEQIGLIHGDSFEFYFNHRYAAAKGFQLPPSALNRIGKYFNQIPDVESSLY